MPLDTHKSVLARALVRAHQVPRLQAPLGLGATHSRARKSRQSFSILYSAVLWLGSYTPFCLPALFIPPPSYVFVVYTFVLLPLCVWTCICACLCRCRLSVCMWYPENNPKCRSSRFLRQVPLWELEVVSYAKLADQRAGP